MYTDSEQSLKSLAALRPPRAARLRLTYQARDKVYLKSPPASVWRGQMGHFLHRLAPDDHHEEDLSLYQRLFRTPRSAVDLPEAFGGHMLGRLGLAGDHVPHPFVMRLVPPPSPGEDVTLEPGATLTVEMVLMENAVETIPSLCAAFESLGAEGIGSKTRQPDGERRRGRTALQEASLHVDPVALELYDGNAWSLPPSCTTDLFEQAAAFSTEDTFSEDPVTLSIRTPLRLKHCGDLVGADRLSVAALGAAYFRRVVGLAVCYGPAPPTPDDASALHDAFLELGDATVLADTEVEWVSDSRYNHRQEQRHPAGGLMGRIQLDGPPAACTAWRRLARQAAPLHLGTKTALGLGHVEPTGS